MKLRWFWLPPIAAVAATCGMFPAVSWADSFCDAPPRVIRDALPPLPKGCQAERIQASGGLSFNVVRSAEKIAEAAWQREVLTKYGEGFQGVNFAACVQTLCVKGAISGTRRCTITGFPCAADMDPRDRDAVKSLALRSMDGRDDDRRDGDRRDDGRFRRDYSDLGPNEIAELQRLLGVTPDGVFGQQSMEALRSFRRQAGLRLDAPPNHEDIERLRRGPRG
jgi:hypothetical protein